MRTENPTSLASGRTKVTFAPPAVGFLLIDSSRKPIYVNSEAIRILTFPAYPPKKKQLETLLAKKVRSVLLHGKRLSLPDFSTEFISGKRRYLCRAIGLQPNTALLLERKAARQQIGRASCRERVKKMEEEGTVKVQSYTGYVWREAYDK